MAIILASAFPYNDVLTSALSGIDSSVLPVIEFIAGATLTVGFLWSIYDAFTKGGDIRSVGLSFLKFGCVSFVILNWGAVFRDVNGCFDNLSSAIFGSSGLTDVWSAWTKGLSAIWKQGGLPSMWSLINGTTSALLSGLSVLIGYLVLPLAMAVFILCYVFWGCILYTLGPLVLALMPSTTLGVFHRKWIENFFVWNCWGLLASTFTALITAIGLGRPDAVMATGNVVGFLQGTSGTLLVSLASVLMSIMIIAIPFTARAILIGEFSPVGASFVLLARAATRLTRTMGGGAATKAATSGGGGAGGGAIATTPGAPLPAASMSGVASGAGGGGSTMGPPPDTPAPSGLTRLFPA
jgi:hypothetical protein